MAPSTVHLPNGLTLTVTPVFGGIQFKPNEWNVHHNAFPAGWTIILHSEDDEDDHSPKPSQAAHSQLEPEPEPEPKKKHIHRFQKPTLRNDHLFISTISNPSTSEFRPSSSPTRHIAMMLWASLWWYFHQPAPPPYLTTPASQNTPDEGRPKGEWILHINREGVFNGKHLLPKLERMGLVTTEDSSVGLDPADGVRECGEGWSQMFASQRAFWQLDARIYLFNLSPAQGPSPYPSVNDSRSGSPSRNSTALTSALRSETSDPSSRANTPAGPFTSGSHLPTYYPPHPLHYTWTNGIRHPIRPKPPRQGETFYTRFVPSLGQYLSFRVACVSPTAVQHHGPTSSVQGETAGAMPNIDALSVQDTDTTKMTDVQLLHKWMNDPRVAYSWGENGPLSHQENFLKAGLASKHSFPVIGCFDGKPFGYFEIYWVKEDRVAAHIGAGGCEDWHRGLHVLVGEKEFRGPHRVRVWLSALVHYCWTADLRTNSVVMEPRVDNAK
ncbi:putative siderophore biosynthesis protein [Teratosphaeria nubilosa]|uniref:Putative siderophore biosynthesis protein n=1 Tax=Teratosphaeria nubilosa TaxID=161662 RepID=A0A6G1LD12_9PEZI|nr:putative siderophore biosynthesis protein [Teratosphaeria nubilosa]